MDDTGCFGAEGKSCGRIRALAEEQKAEVWWLCIRYVRTYWCALCVLRSAWLLSAMCNVLLVPAWLLCGLCGHLCAERKSCVRIRGDSCRDLRVSRHKA